MDIQKGPQVDITADMHALPFADSSAAVVYTRHTLEHVQNPHQCIRELYRVCKNDGIVHIIVPHYSNSAYWADLTHLRPFSARTFEYFNLEYARNAGFTIYLPEVNFKTLKVKLVYWPERIIKQKKGWKRGLLRTINFIFSGIANLNLFLCERLWCYWVGGFYEVEFILSPVKPIPNVNIRVNEI